MDEKSLQETYAPSMACFGCGPANEKGLRIRSFLVADFVLVALLILAPGLALWLPSVLY